MKFFLGLSSLTVCAASGVEAKYRPWTDACAGLDASATCRKSFTGICKTYHGELRCASPWGCSRSRFRYAGDCGFLKDGDGCMLMKEGYCKSAGRCPKFNGEMICQWDKRAAEVTMIAPGTPEGSLVLSMGGNATLVPMGCDGAAVIDPSHADGKLLRADGDLKLSLRWKAGVSTENPEVALSNAVSSVLAKVFGSDVDIDDIEAVVRRLAEGELESHLQFATAPTKQRLEDSEALRGSIVEGLRSSLANLAAVTVTSLSVQWCGHSVAAYGLGDEPGPQFPVTLVVVGASVFAVAVVAAALACMLRRGGAQAKSVDAVKAKEVDDITEEISAGNEVKANDVEKAKTVPDTADPV